MLWSAHLCSNHAQAVYPATQSTHAPIHTHPHGGMLFFHACAYLRCAYTPPQTHAQGFQSCTANTAVTQSCQLVPDDAFLCPGPDPRMGPWNAKAG